MSEPTHDCEHCESPLEEEEECNCDGAEAERLRGNADNVEKLNGLLHERLDVIGELEAENVVLRQRAFELETKLERNEIEINAMRSEPGNRPGIQSTELADVVRECLALLIDEKSYFASLGKPRTDRLRAALAAIDADAVPCKWCDGARPANLDFDGFPVCVPCIAIAYAQLLTMDGEHLRRIAELMRESDRARRFARAWKALAKSYRSDFSGPIRIQWLKP